MKRRSFGSIEETWFTWAAKISAALFIAYFAGFGIWRFLSFQLELDWCKIANAVYQTSRGSFFGNHVNGLVGYSFFQEHISPLLFLYVPFFRLSPFLGNIVLITSQAIANGLAGWLLFLLGQRWFKSKLCALFCELFFLCNSRIQMATLHDYHMLTLLPFFLFLAFLGVEKKSRLYLWLGVLGGLAVREDAFLALLGVPLYIAWAKREWRPAILMLAVILAYEMLLFRFLFPMMRDGKPYLFFRHYHWLADSPGALIRRLLIEPHKVCYQVVTERHNAPLLLFLGQFFFLPLLSIPGWLTGLPAMSESLLSNVHQLTCYGYHYAVPPAAALTVATLLTLRVWSVRIRRRLSFKLFGPSLLILLTLYNFGFSFFRGAQPLSKFSRSPDVRLEKSVFYKIRAVRRLMRQIPPHAVCSLSVNLFGRYHAAPNVRLFRRIRGITDDVQYLLLDPNCRIRRYGFKVNSSILNSLVSKHGWQEVDRDCGVVLLRRGNIGNFPSRTSKSRRGGRISDSRRSGRACPAPANIF